jgi:hypothetical protein
MKLPMKVDFDDTVENWRLWGELVEFWSANLHPKPDNVANLVNQMVAHGISGANVYGPPDREVRFYSVTDNDPLTFMLPTRQDLGLARSAVRSGMPYPLPAFYDLAYNGTRQALGDDQLNLFAACRLGELSATGTHGGGIGPNGD